MKLVKQILIKKEHPLYAECDRLCFLSKNVYNVYLYRIKQQYEKDSTFLRYSIINKQMRAENNIDFRAIGGEIAAQTLMLLERNYKSYFISLKDYQKNPNKYSGLPKPPTFKHKTKGRFVAVYTNKNVSKKQLKKGYLSLSGTLINIKTNGRLINADVNGACNILRKEIPNAFANGIEGVLSHPQVIKIF